MAKSYIFLKPRHLPLVAEKLDRASVTPIDADEVVACLRQALPSLTWSSPTDASGETDSGWVEFSQPGQGADRSLTLRCSLRSDYEPLVQNLCDQFGWVAFDEKPLLFQPHRSPEAV